MTFSVTPHGILACIPLFRLPGGAILGDLYWSTDRSHRRDAAVLYLEEDPDSRACSSIRPSYRVSCSLARVFWTDGCLNSETGEYMACGETVRASWQEVLIRHRPPLRRLPGQLSDPRTTSIPPVPMQLSLDSPFRFDPAHIRKFMHEFATDRVSIFAAEPHRSHMADSGLALTYLFERSSSEFIIIQAGHCQRDWVPGTHPRPAPGPIWAKVSGVASLTSPTRAREEAMKLKKGPAHDCFDDHISRWSGLRKTFHLNVPWYHLAAMSPVILTFTPCPINPERTLILDASLGDRGLLIAPRETS